MTNGLKITQEHNYITIQNEIKELENEVIKCSSHTPAKTQDILRKIATVLIIPVEDPENEMVPLIK